LKAQAYKFRRRDALDCSILTATPLKQTMPEERDPDLAAWIAAETAAYTAIHALHQRTQGGRFAPPDHRIEQIARLRKEADVRFASLWGALGASVQACEPASATRSAHAGPAMSPAARTRRSDGLRAVASHPASAP
jgi:hypothetical protein